MKYLHCGIKLGFIILFFTGFTPGKSLAALPLQVGVYHGGGSRYIQIAEKQNRICFKDRSSNGVTVASFRGRQAPPNLYRQVFARARPASKKSAC